MKNIPILLADHESNNAVYIRVVQDGFLPTQPFNLEETTSSRSKLQDIRTPTMIIPVNSKLSYCDVQDGRGRPSSFVLSQVFTQSCKEVMQEFSRPGTQHRCDPHCKKRLTIFPSPVGMSLTKLSLGGNYWQIRQKHLPKHWLGGGVTSGVRFGLAHSSDGL